MSNVIDRVIAALGGPGRAGERLGLSRTTPLMWRRLGQIPVRHVLAIERATGISRHELRPDLYEPVDPARREAA